MTKKSLSVRKIEASEVQLLHDFYFESAEPDAPKVRFSELNADQRSNTLSRYRLDQHHTVLLKEDIVGFFGLYPDAENSYLNIFYVLNPKLRGQGLFHSVLAALVQFCKDNRVSSLRAVTRAANTASVKGLLRASFEQVGQHTEEYSDDPKDDVLYEVYVARLSNQNFLEINQSDLIVE